ncbi:MAG TPA: chemotaxis protein CheW [Kofleriaceae bacterium]|nr:chemotaxis protein CheW [Kofleriaceae bacterium]
MSRPVARGWDEVREEDALSLVCRLAGRLCALPLTQVVETMRPLRVEPVAAAPAFVRGVAIIRGVPVPVVDAAALVGGGEEAAQEPTRFVALRIGGRQVALAVDEVLGVRAMPAGALRELPPLLRGGPAEVLASIGALDAELLFALESARAVPETLWRSLAAQEPAR